jgi:tetratricopeptide (TPR) repeat protein
MRFRGIVFFAVCLAFPTAYLAQSSPSSARTGRSHVERFSSPEARAGRAEAEATAKINANSSDPEAYNARSLARMHLGQYAEAQDDLRRAIALKPTEAEYHANLGYVLWKLGHFEEAIRAERAALGLDEKNFTAHYQLGRFLLRIGDKKQFSEASTHLQRAVELQPLQSEVRFELLATYRALGDTARATAQLDLLQDARPSDPRVTYIRGLIASDNGDLKLAITNFREALRVNPDLYGAWQDLGVAYLKLKSWPEAVESFSELVRRQPDSPEAAYFHALTLFNSHRDTDAEREVRRALRLDAGSAEASTLLGIILFTRGGAAVEARDALAQATALDPGNFDAFYYLGRVQGDMKDYTGATANLRTAVKLDPRHQFARFLLGYALEMTGQFDAALGEYEALVKIDSNSAVGQMGLGAIALKQARIEEAITTLQRAVSLDPSIFEAQWSLGRALVLAKRDSEAIDAFSRAIQIAPDRPDGHYQLGLVLQRTGRKEEAAREFSIVSRLTTAFRTGATP